MKRKLERLQLLYRDVFPSKNEYLSSVQLQQAFKSNPSHLIGPFKKWVGLIVQRNMELQRETELQETIGSTHTSLICCQITGRMREMNELHLSHIILEMKTKFLPTSYLSLYCSVSYYNPNYYVEVQFYLTSVASQSPKVTFDWRNLCKSP